VTRPEKYIDGLKNQPLYRELVRVFSPDPAKRLKAEARSTELRDQIATLREHLAKLPPNCPEEC
jgi:hypothetical protein